MLLITLLLIKHFLADFPLQTNSMVVGKGQRVDWEGWLFSHCLVHAALTFLIVLIFADWQASGAAALIDLGLHFIIDRIKAHPDLGGQYKPDQKAFWVALGADQLAHGLTYMLIAVCISGG